MGIILSHFRKNNGVLGRIVAASRQQGAFTLRELLVVLGTCSLLGIIALSALGNAKGDARQLACLNNLRQLAAASRMYVVQYEQFPGSLSVITGFYYVWPPRLLDFAQGNRKIFGCPAAAPNSWWDTNLNATLGATGPNGVYDQWGISSSTRFSYGYNDWGLNIAAHPQLGLQGDVNGSFNKGPVRDSDVVAPNQMIMIGDTPPPQNPGLIVFNANLDPADDSFSHAQRPSNRHQYLTDIVFTDGHTETPFRNDVINPAPNNAWRNRWNNDNQPHNETTWIVNPVSSKQLDP